MFYVLLSYIFLIPLEYIQDKIPKGPTGINYGNLSMVVATIWMLTSRPGGRGFKPTPAPLNGLLIGMLVLCWFGMVMTYFTIGLPFLNPFDINSMAFKRLLYLFNGFLFFWLAANMLDSRKKMRWAILAIIASMPIVWRSFRSDLSYASGWHYNDEMRVKGPFTDLGSNELGTLFCFGAIFMLLLGIHRRRLWEKCTYLFGGSLYVYGVLYCYSRATQLGFIFAMSMIAFLRHRWVLILFAMAFMTTDLWLPQSVVDRWEMTTDDEGNLDDSAQSRKDFWKLAVQLWGESPIIGHGWGSFFFLNPARMDTHNIYYRTLAEQGLVGMALFLAIWYGIFRIGSDLWLRGRNPFDRHYGFAIIIATISMMLMNYFGDRFTHLAMIGQYWVFVGIGARLRSAMFGWEPLTADGPLLEDEIDDRPPFAPGEAPQPDGGARAPWQPGGAAPIAPVPAQSVAAARNGRPIRPLRIVGRKPAAAGPRTPQSMVAPLQSIAPGAPARPATALDSQGHPQLNLVRGADALRETQLQAPSRHASAPPKAPGGLRLVGRPLEAAKPPERKRESNIGPRQTGPLRPATENPS